MKSISGTIVATLGDRVEEAEVSYHPLGIEHFADQPQFYLVLEAIETILRKACTSKVWREGYVELVHNGEVLHSMGTKT